MRLPLILPLALALALAAQAGIAAPADSAHTFPVPKSQLILGWEWQGDQVAYPDSDVRGDTYPMTWGPDGEIYTSAGDPGWGIKRTGLDLEKFAGPAPNYKITQVNAMGNLSGEGGGGAKPTGMIAVAGTLYLAVQNLNGKGEVPNGKPSQSGTDAAIYASKDTSKTWTPNPGASTQAVMFPGYKFGGPAFVNYGKDNAGAVDNYVYAVSAEQWDNGDNLRCGRVPKDKIQDAAAWEWVADTVGAGKAPRWTKNLDSAQAVLHDQYWISAPEMVYIAKLKRYLLLEWHFNWFFSPTSGSHLIVYESPNPWGPFRLVHHEEVWESQALTPYCPRLPLKWFNPDSLSGWLQFSGSWNAYWPGGTYRSHVRKFRLLTSGTTALGPVARRMRAKAHVPALVDALGRGGTGTGPGLDRDGLR